MRATARIVGVSTNTVLAVKLYAQEHFEAVNQIMLKELEVSELQLDEFWSFVKKKKKMPQKKRKNKK